MKWTFWITSLLIGGMVLGASDRAGAAQIWKSTFDATADGVVDIFNNNLGKVMIGPVSGGRLQIEAWDNSTNAFTPDKAGRPLGATLSGGDSMSGQYKFNWSTLETSETQAYEAVGFLGNASPQTRQILGSVLRHWKAGQDYYVAVDVAVGSVGASNFGYLAGPAFWLGTNPTANDYEFRVQYDGSTHELDLELLDDSGVQLTGQWVDLDTDVLGLQDFGGVDAELGALALSHLGWSDYSGNLGDRATVWQVDSLAYFDDAKIPEPSTCVLILLGAVAGLVGRRRG